MLTLRCYDEIARISIKIKKQKKKHALLLNIPNARTISKLSQSRNQFQDTNKRHSVYL